MASRGSTSALKSEQRKLLAAVNRQLDQAASSLNKVRRRIDALRRRKTIITPSDAQTLVNMHGSSVQAFASGERALADFLQWVQV